MVVLYASETCPKCEIMKEKLENKQIDFTTIIDQETMIKNEIKKVDNGNLPVLEVNGVKMSFKIANEWVNNYNG